MVNGDLQLDPYDRLISSLKITDMLDTIAHWNNFLQLSRSAKLGLKGWFLANFTTGPGITGYLMLISLMAIVFTALEKPRRRNFERFWYTHHLFLLFFILWQFHGAFCMIPNDRAPFCSKNAVFYRYWLFGALIYLTERLLREFRGRQTTYISKVIQHPSRVCEIQIKKEHCISKAGQYIFLCCPEISLHQYVSGRHLMIRLLLRIPAPIYADVRTRGGLHFYSHALCWQFYKCSCQVLGL